MSRSPRVHCAGVVLVGGRSSRMGREKALITVDGVPLWKRQFGLLSQCCSVVALASSVRPSWLSGDEEWIADSPLGEGPVRGILSGLVWADKKGARGLIVLAVDLPGIEADFIWTLSQKAKDGRGQIGVHGDRFEPLCACYPVAAFERLRQRVLEGENRLQVLVTDLIQQNFLETCPLSEGEKSGLFNLNTPQDLAEWEQRNG